MNERTGSTSYRPTLHVVVASTRPGRVGLPIGEWFYRRAVEQGTFQVEWVDLAEIDLPMFDEPLHPRLRQYRHQHTRDWSNLVERADAFAFVIPEYNFGFTAPLKNALDYLSLEWRYKPAGIVSYGGVAAGTRAAQMLKPVLAALKMMPLSEAVSIPFVKQFLDESGQVRANEVMEQSATAMLAELGRWELALRSLRREVAVPS